MQSIYARTAQVQGGTGRAQPFLQHLTGRETHLGCSASHTQAAVVK
jgi:hypothetical protein